MRKFSGVFVVALAAVSMAGWSAPARSSGTQPTVKLKIELKSPIGSMGVREMTIHGANYRYHGAMSGQQTGVIKNRDGVYQLNYLHNMAVKFYPGTVYENPAAFMIGPLGDVKAYLAKVRAKKVKTEKVSGRECDVYSYVDHDFGKKGAPCKLWVDKKGAPAKMYVDGPRPPDKITITYLAYKTGVSISDSEFKLPKGWTVIEQKEIDQIRERVRKSQAGKKDAGKH